MLYTVSRVFWVMVQSELGLSIMREAELMVYNILPLFTVHMQGEYVKHK